VHQRLKTVAPFKTLTFPELGLASLVGGEAMVGVAGCTGDVRQDGEVGEVGGGEGKENNLRGGLCFRFSAKRVSVEEDEENEEGEKGSMSILLCRFEEERDDKEVVG